MLPSLPIPMFGALLLAFLCLSMLIKQGRATALAIFVGLCAAQSALIALVLHYQLGWARLLLPVTACALPPMAWIALCRSGMERRAREEKHLLAPILACLAVVFAPSALDLLIPLTFFAYGGAILYALSGGADALPRLRLESGDQSGRIWRFIGAGLIASGISDLTIFGALVSGAQGWVPWIVTFGSTGILLFMGALSLEQSLGDLPETRDPAEPVPNHASEQDTEIMAHLEDLIETHRLYLDPDLTLSRLSRRLGIPVKTLSSAINRTTGQNVSRYINERRIKAACEALSRGASVTDAMLGSGFNTKSNFNREFLRLTGMTPREYKD